MIHYFSSFFKAFRKESDSLRTAVIIAEYNPFHSGHEYLIKCAKEHGAECIIAVMSGNFVQRGDISILSKFDRTRMALLGGA
ncbi:MAG: nucleotidyltransferase family protein, partial [Oscillospiraceae bacterium]|nr:nucleotidyltransferase family protein [Oscillospiraceae bacterium]